MKSNGFLAWYFHGKSSDMSKLSATNLMYIDINVAFMPMRLMGSASGF